MSIESIKARTAAATPGPWLQGWWSGHCRIPAHGTRHPGPPDCKYDPVFIEDEHGLAGPGGVRVAGNYDYEEGGIVEPGDQSFIAHARTDIPALLAVAEAAELLTESIGYCYKTRHLRHTDKALGQAEGDCYCSVNESLDAVRSALAALEAQP